MSPPCCVAASLPDEAMAKSAKGKNDLDTVVLTHPSGASAEIYLWGATLASYKSPSGKETRSDGCRASNRDKSSF